MKLVSVDIETTGLDPNRHEMWEVALTPVEFVAGSVSLGAAFTAQRFPARLHKAEPNALRISRFYERFNKRAGSEGQSSGHKYTHDPRYPLTYADGSLAVALAKQLDGATIIGAAPHFDAAFLSKFLRGNGQCPTWSHRLIDIQSMAMGYFRESEPQSLSDLIERFHIKMPVDQRHTAFGDALAVCSILGCIMSDSPEDYPRDSE